MNASELAFYSSRELVDELVSRQSFLGVIVHSVEETRGRCWTGNQEFQVRFNENLGAEGVRRLLNVIAEEIIPPEIEGDANG
jgi:hypothetical protein